MKLSTRFTVGGRDYSLLLDTRKAQVFPDRAEWLIRDGEKVLEITAWREGGGYDPRALADLYEGDSAYLDEEMSDSTSIQVLPAGGVGWMRNPNADVPAEVITHYVVRDYQRMLAEHDGLLTKVAELEGRLKKAERKAEHYKTEAERAREKVKKLKGA